MKALLNYTDGMSDKRYLYCSTVLELVKRGYTYRNARYAVSKSGILNQTEGKYGWMMFHNGGNEDWADIVEKTIDMSTKETEIRLMA